MDQDVNEDLIEATIRRVAEAKAAREAAERREQPDGDPDPPEAAVTEAKEPQPEFAAPRQDLPPSPAPVDEDLIEATIRKVAAARAAKEAEAAAPVSPAAVEMPDGEAIAPIIRPRPIFPSMPEPEEPAEPAEDGRMVAELRTLRQEVGAMQGMLRELQARVDSTLAFAEASTPSTRPAQDDGWNGEVELPRVPMGQVRPAVLRNPAPQTATAEHLVEAVEQDPSTEPKRALDLLPRTYRVTVEDKRRGVDLVPLHRALLGMDGVREMSLLSYSNGVAIISIEMLHELDPEALREAVSRAMSRGARVEVHNEATMVVKLAEE